MPSSEVTSVLITVRPTTTMMPLNRSDTTKPWLIAATAKTTAPFRTSTPMPSVRTVKGSANLIRSGHTSALKSPISAAATSAAPKPVTSTPERSALSNISVAAVMSQMAITRRKTALRPANRLIRALDELHRSCAAYSGDLVPLGVGRPPVADVKQRGQDDPELPPTGQPDTGYVDDHVDQGREREEDDTKQRQDERIEGRVDEGWSGYPDDEQPEPREEPCK